MDWLDPLLQLPPWLTHGLSGAAAALIITGVIRRARADASRPRDSRRSEWTLTVIAAMIATGVALQGMWALFDTLQMPLAARIALCGFVEIAMTISAIRARRNLLQFGSTGVDGIAVWVFAGLNALLATLEARSLAEHLLRLSAPFVAAWLWHRGMVGEYQDVQPRRRQPVAWRITPERVLVWLRLAEPGEREIAEIDGARRRAALARAALRYHSLPDGWRRRVAGWMLRRRGFSAVERLGLGVNPDVIDGIRTTLAAVYQLAPGTAPAAVEPVDPWQLAPANHIQPPPDGPDGAAEPEPDVLVDLGEPPAAEADEDRAPAPETVHATVHVDEEPTVHARAEDARTHADARPEPDRDAVYARWREDELSPETARHWPSVRVGEECRVSASQGSRIRAAWLARLRQETEEAHLRLVHTS
jgi:hypothetical protein